MLFSRKNSSEQQQILTKLNYIPAMGQFLAVRTKLVREEEYVFLRINSKERLNLYLYYYY